MISNCDLTLLQDKVEMVEERERRLDEKAVEASDGLRGRMGGQRLVSLEQWTGITET